MRGIERERECGTGADHRDTVVRTVVFAFASLAAWWCCSNVASAAEVHPSDRPADHHADHAANDTPAAEAPAEPAGPAVPVEPTVAPLVAPSEAPSDVPAAPSDVPAAPAAAVEPGPMLFPVVVAPLVDAVTPAVAPGGAAVFPVLDAVTTPAEPVLHVVMPVADRVVGPVVAPAAAPAVGFVRPVVEQVAASAAPFVQLVAPAVVPVVQPVTGVVAPLVDQVVTSVADPLVGVTQPALRSVLELDPRYLVLRPATAELPVDLDPVATLTSAAVEAVAPAPVPVDAPGRTARSAADDGHDAAGPVADPAVFGSAAGAPTAAPAPFGRPFRGAFPPQRAVVMTQGSPDSSQRSQRLLAVLSSSAGSLEARTTALQRIPVESPLARFGGRPPVTPD